MTTTNATKIDMLTEGCEITDGSETVVLSFPDLDTGPVVVRLDKRELTDGTDLIRVAEAVDYCDDEIAGAHEAGRAEAQSEFDQEGVRRQLEEWHNTHHESVLRFCYADPCKSIRDALDRSE